MGEPGEGKEPSSTEPAGGAAQPQFSLRYETTEAIPDAGATSAALGPASRVSSSAGPSLLLLRQAVSVAGSMGASLPQSDAQGAASKRELLPAEKC